MQYIICAPGISLERFFPSSNTKAAMIHVSNYVPPGEVYFYESREDWENSVDDLKMAVERFKNEDEPSG